VGLSALLGMPPGSNATGGDLAASLGAAAAAALPNCVQFVGTDPITGSSPHIENGLLWNYNTKLGTKFFWEFWMRPGIGDSPAVNSACDGYLISTSTGGAHRLLFGPSSGGLPNNLWTLSGNVLLSNGTIISYATTDGVAAGQWIHAAVVADVDGGGNCQLQVLVDGYLFGLVQAISAAQIGAGVEFASPVIGSGYSSLCVGHSDHQNSKCRLAALRAFDRSNPPGAIGTLGGYMPQRSFGNEFVSKRASLAQIYTTPGTVPDVSDGYDQGTPGATLLHFPGRVCNGKGDGYPFPAFVNDPNCPYGRGGDLVNHFALGSAENPLALPSLPIGAKIFDSFNRAPQSWIWTPNAGPTIGPSDARASRGAVTPQQGMIGGGATNPVPSTSPNQLFEICNGRLRARPYQGCVIWWDSGSVVQDVRCSRIGPNPGGNSTAALVHVADQNNFLGAFIFSNTSNNGPIVIVDYQGGGNVLGFGTQFNPTNSAWTTLRVTIDVSNVMRVYVDDGAGGWEQWGSTYTDATKTSATGVGTGSSIGLGGTGGGWVCDNFTAV
jgi:hypothetical protein